MNMSRSGVGGMCVLLYEGVLTLVPGRRPESPRERVELIIYVSAFMSTYVDLKIQKLQGFL